MYSKVLEKMQRCVQQGQYVVRPHVHKRMRNRGLAIKDVERAILTGRIIERQWDNTYQEFKYIVRGMAMSGDEIEVAAKIDSTDATIIITIYRT